MKARSMWLCAAFLVVLPAVSAEKPAPAWLQGRASDTDPAPPIETSSTIDALCQRPKDVSEFVRNLKVVWDKKLLTQPAFFRNKSLTCFFGGASVTLNKKGSISVADTVRRLMTITLDENIFPHATIQAQISIINRPAVPGLPARVEYVGILDLNVEAASSLKLKEVRSIFGQNFRKLSANVLSPHGMPMPAPGKVFVFYLYPGDVPEKYGAAELPQIRFLLKQGDVAPSQPQGEEPQDSDLVASIFASEHANRK